MEHEDVDDMGLLELQRERLKSARERAQYLSTIASSTRWTMIAVSAHAGAEVLTGSADLPTLALLAAAAPLAFLKR